MKQCSVQRTHPSNGPRALVWLLAVGLLAVALSACGGSSKSTSSTASPGQVGSPPPRSGCGSYAAPPVSDPDHVVASLPTRYEDAYRGFGPVFKSTWRSFKSTHEPPYTVAIVFAGTVNQFAIDFLDELKSQLKKSRLVGKTTVSTTGQEVNVPLQLQQYAAAVARKPDLIIVAPLQAEPFFGPVRKAAASGIPTVALIGHIDIPEALNVTENAFQMGAQTASGIVRLIDGEGGLLYVHGYRTVAADTGAFAGTKAVLAHCPDVKLVGEIDGAFVDATAKAETFKFLATHPAQLAAVQQTGGMGKGVLSAFMSTGRPIPPIGLIGAERAMLSYWQEHRGSYHTVAVPQSARNNAAAAVSIGLRTLLGQGPKVNSFVGPVTLITEKNLGQWAEPGWTLNTGGMAPGPNGAYLPDSYLDELFEHGKPPN
jgi:ribose transport system substrate-binding protein